MKRLTLSKPYHSESRSLWYVMLEDTKDDTGWEVIASFPRKENAEAFLDSNEYCETCGKISPRDGGLNAQGLYQCCGICRTRFAED